MIFLGFSILKTFLQYGCIHLHLFQILGGFGWFDPKLNCAYDFQAGK